MSDSEISVSLVNETIISTNNLDKTIYDLNNQIDLLSSKADALDYFIAVSSGILCGMLDILWVGDFSLERGRDFASKKVDSFVIKIAKLLGCEDNDVQHAVKFLEDKFKLASDGNMADFGGGKQHHLRDFAHHPTCVGLMFSLLTQFTEYSFGTDTNGVFIYRRVPKEYKCLIGKSIPDKIFRGTVIWMFHLISDMAGSNMTAGLSGGTGIPGPIISTLKELSVLPGIRNLHKDEISMSQFLSKMFNGTLFAEHDSNGRIIKGTEIKLDFRGELGALAELGRQALPVLANDCIVRTFYFIRQFGIILKNSNISSIRDFPSLDWKSAIPFNNPTISRMLLIATGVFTTIDMTDAVLSGNIFVSVNYVGVGRFTVAVGTETINCLKVRKLKEIREMYEEVKKNTFTAPDNKVYGRIKEGMNVEKLGLNKEQTELLYNVQLQKTMYDVEQTRIVMKNNDAKKLKEEWIKEWKHYIEIGFADFVQDNDASIHWYRKQEILDEIRWSNPKDVWFRLLLLEAMLFEPYFPLSLEKNKKGEDVPSEKYRFLHNPLYSYKKSIGDEFFDDFFQVDYYQKGYVKRLRKTYDKVTRELNEVLKTTIRSLTFSAVIAFGIIATAGMFAPAIAVALVGSNFTGLSGAALTSACLAYIGGGAVAAGGMGVAGGTMAIVGGGAILGVGVGASTGVAIGAAGLIGKEATISQSAKLMVAVREIFLNDEHDIEYSNTIYEQYVQRIQDLEKQLVDLKLKQQVAPKEEQHRLKMEIKNLEESTHAMEIAMRSMNRFKSSFEMGIQTDL